MNNFNKYSLYSINTQANTDEVAAHDRELRNLSDYNDALNYIKSHFDISGESANIEFPNNQSISIDIKTNDIFVLFNDIYGSRGYSFSKTQKI